MNKPRLKARLLDHAQNVVVFVAAVAVGVSILRLSNDQDNVLVLALALVMAFGAGSLVEDLMTGALASTRGRLDAAAAAFALRAIGGVLPDRKTASPAQPED